MDTALINWLLSSDEPWTRYRCLVDLRGYPPASGKAQAARLAMLAHPQVQALVSAAAAWPGSALKRHNNAGHALHILSMLADFGLHASDPGMPAVVAAVSAHQSAQGAFQTLANVPVSFGGSGQDAWTWMACDAPLLLYALTSFGEDEAGRMPRAVDHLVNQVADNGWRCSVAPELGASTDQVAVQIPARLPMSMRLRPFLFTPSPRQPCSSHRY